VAASTGFRNGAGDGGSFINLRGLSPKRTLVLLDGKRVVQSQASLRSQNVDLGRTTISAPESVTASASMVGLWAVMDWLGVRGIKKGPRGAWCKRPFGV